MPAIVAVDLQRDFCDPRSRPAGGREKAYCIPQVRKLLAVGRAAGWPIVHVLTRHSGTETLPRRLRDRGVRPFCVRGTGGELPVDGLVRTGETIVWKTSYSGFVGTDLAAQLADQETVVLCGVASDCCVHQTAFDASERHDKRVVMAYDGTSARSQTAHIAGLLNVEKSAGLVLSTNDLILFPPEEWPQHAMSAVDIDARVRALFARCGEALRGFADPEADAEIGPWIASIVERLERLPSHAEIVAPNQGQCTAAGLNE